MSKTRSKQDIEDKLEDFSNVSKTILKQGIEAEVWYIAPMFQYELADLCLRLGRSKILRRVGDLSNVSETIVKFGILR